MPNAATICLPETLEEERLSPAQRVELIRAQAATITALTGKIDALTQQINWFQRQLFGSKSERLAPNPQQLHLGEIFPAPSSPAADQRKMVHAHSRRVPSRSVPEDVDAVPFFDETRVPVQTIVVPNPHVEGLAPEQYAVYKTLPSDKGGQMPALRQCQSVNQI